jgi:hypothetical protein
MAPTGSSHLNGALAALCAGGGVYGYTKAKSVPSVGHDLLRASPLWHLETI